MNFPVVAQSVIEPSEGEFEFEDVYVLRINDIDTVRFGKFEPFSSMCGMMISTKSGRTINVAIPDDFMEPIKNVYINQLWNAESKSPRFSGEIRLDLKIKELIEESLE